MGIEILSQKSFVYFTYATEPHDIPVPAPCEVPLVLTPKPVTHLWIGIYLFFF